MGNINRPYKIKRGNIDFTFRVWDRDILDLIPPENLTHNWSVKFITEKGAYRQDGMFDENMLHDEKTLHEFFDLYADGIANRYG